ncbi:hypothetical protein PMAYCL1PPCAC_25714, partial [Pristionchus mayeri]
FAGNAADSSNSLVLIASLKEKLRTIPNIQSSSDASLLEHVNGLIESAEHAMEWLRDRQSNSEGTIAVDIKREGSINNAHADSLMNVSDVEEDDAAMMKEVENMENQAMSENDSEADSNGAWTVDESEESTSEEGESSANEENKKISISRGLGKFKCPDCGRMCTTTYGLKVHKLTHSGDRRFK